MFKERALAGSYDIVWANNAVYLALREKGMVSVIARGEPSFRGMVVILKDAPYTVVSDLKGARIAAVSPESIAGFLFLKKLFANEGMDIYSDSTLSFASKVESIPFLVVNGKADAGVFVEDLYLRSPTYDAAMARLRILVKSPPIPQFPFAVKKSMDPGLVKALEKALSEFDGSTEDERSFLYELRLDKIITADDASYDEFSVFLKKCRVENVRVIKPRPLKLVALMIGLAASMVSTVLVVSGTIILFVDNSMRNLKEYAAYMSESLAAAAIDPMLNEAYISLEGAVETFRGRQDVEGAFIADGNGQIVASLQVDLLGSSADDIKTQAGYFFRRMRIA